MQYEHYVFTPDSICRELDKVSTKDWIRLIKMQSFGSFVLRIARLSAKADTLELDDQPDLSYFKQDFYKLLRKLLHQKGINVIQNTSEDVAEPGPTEEELAREENERKHSQYLTRARKERMIEVRSHTHLQKLGIGDLVIVKGEVKRYYEGGKPVMCNYILILSNGDEVHAVITNEHYKQRGEELKSYVGEFISFEGKVVNNPFLKKKSIKSEPLYFPVSKIESPDDLNTNLDFQDDE